MNNTNKLEQTWRWYGPEDTVTLQDIKQAGATGIVTALHHVAHGEIWTIQEINQRKKQIEDAGLKWSVVESLPVHEAIKTQNRDAGKYLDNYRQSLTNLSACGIKTVCYNFMPVLDWTRTKLDFEMKNGSKALYFDWVDIACFDIHILNRNNAKKDYSQTIAEAAEARNNKMTDKEKAMLQETILMGIPGEKNTTLKSLQESIDTYQAIGFDGLRSNLLYFLESIAGVCSEESIKMTIHPDDPPFPILGLPRIASNEKDLEFILKGVKSEFNGICFCTGSLGAGCHNDVSAIFEAVKSRVYFVHLRNIRKDESGNFYEADHLDGDVNMYKIMKALVKENNKRNIPIPFRPDHGHQMLDDLQKTTHPGYSAIGRLKGLAELRGLELGIMGQE